MSRPRQTIRGVTVADHQSFRDTLTGSTDLHISRLMSDDDLDEIDRELDMEIETDPYNRQPSSRKSDKELNRVLSILDSLQTGKDDDEP